MTRFLAEALEATEPHFRSVLGRLELAHGNPSTDIRLTTEVHAATRAKMIALGLDPNDTTPKELYLALIERLRKDDARIARRLHTLAVTHISLEAGVTAGMAHALNDLPYNRTAYALKASTAKALIKKQPPKKAMKQLGYRSLESMLKHEPVSLIITAARLCEPASWYKRFAERYKSLSPVDFETRPLSILHPVHKRWQKLAGESSDRFKHTVISLPEFGSIVLLPLPAHAPVGVTTASLVLALHALNQVHSTTTYLKLCQVRPDFGAVVESITHDEPHLEARLADSAVPWHIVQRYYGRIAHFTDGQFGPHVHGSDLSWHGVERALALIEPGMHFWQDSQHLALLGERTPVSLNVVDAALNLCNQIPYEQRLTHYFKSSLWHELLLRYLKHDTVEQAVQAELQPALAVN